ncbi:MAG TPA: Ig domain-containing protein [Candidatus Acidoferrum sp.]|nr:Ig domain-containing protein [Candidatus Acidoferrum sp.]
MKTLVSRYLAAGALMAWTAPMMAQQNQVIWADDNGGGLSGTPATATSGLIVYQGSDAFWAVVIASGEAFPPLVGQETLSGPALNLAITASAVGGANANLHPLSLVFSADGYGPTAGALRAMLTGHRISGSPQPFRFSTFYNATDTLGTNPPAVLVSDSGSLSFAALGSGLSWTSAPVTLAASYSLTEVLTIAASTLPASYSFQASLMFDCPAITVTPTNLPDATLGVAYSQDLTAAGGGPPYAFTLWSGSLPPGLALSGAGLVSGTPTNAGSYSFHVVAADTNGCQGVLTCALSVNQPARPRIDSIAIMPSGQVKLHVSGDPGQYAVESTPDLAGWAPLATCTNSNVGFEYVDSDTNQLARYYRVKVAP